MLRVYTTIFLLCCSANSFAKCGFETYLVEGLISNASGTPSINIRVDIQWEDNAGIHKKFVTANTEGRYEFKIPFDTYSGYGEKSEPEDVCKQKMEQLSLRIKDKTFNKKVNI
jgi:hypothetical protein